MAAATMPLLWAAPPELQNVARRLLGDRRAAVVLGDRLPPLTSNGATDYVGLPLLVDGRPTVLLRADLDWRETVLTLLHECFHLARGEANTITGGRLVWPGWVVNEAEPERWAGLKLAEAERRARINGGAVPLGALGVYQRRVLDAIR